MTTDHLTDATAEIERLESEIQERRAAIARLRRQAAAQPVADYMLEGPEGLVSLSSLFGERTELLVIHNMGRACRFCTMWADGFNGLLPHLEDRAAFVVVSPDEPAVQQAFAAKRGWRFRMVSAHGSPFSRELGFEDEQGVWPGVSALERRPDGTIVRVDRAVFGPGDDFCAAWHLFDLLPGGRGEWHPRLSYRRG